MPACSHRYSRRRAAPHPDVIAALRHPGLRAVSSARPIRSSASSRSWRSPACAMRSPLRGAGGGGVANHRRAGRQGPDREDHDRAWARGRSADGRDPLRRPIDGYVVTTPIRLDRSAVRPRCAYADAESRDREGWRAPCSLADRRRAERMSEREHRYLGGHSGQGNHGRQGAPGRCRAAAPAAGPGAGDAGGRAGGGRGARGSPASRW